MNVHDGHRQIIAFFIELFLPIAAIAIFSFSLWLVPDWPAIVVGLLIATFPWNAAVPLIIFIAWNL
jgi:hypothetical protein